MHLSNCLLYTSDAADEEDSVDLGGRRIIKKPPPTPNNPDKTPTKALNKMISIAVTCTCAIGKNTSI